MFHTEMKVVIVDLRANVCRGGNPVCQISAIPSTQHFRFLFLWP